MATNKGLLDRITATDPSNRAALIRRRAKELKQACALHNMAFKPGDEFIDSISDAEWETFKKCCDIVGLKQREDFRWEVK